MACLSVTVPGRVEKRKSREPVNPHEDEDRFRIAFEFASVGIAMVDLEGNFFEANKALSDLFGFAKSELQRMNLDNIWVPEERKQARAEFKKAAAGGKARTHFERQYLNRQGEILSAEVTRGLARGEDGEPMYFIVSFRDVTEGKRMQVLLEEQASTDVLTGTMNRNRIEEKASFELMRCDRYGEKLSLLMIDLDHFKVVNDSRGHLAGDRVLREFCEITRNCLRSTDLLGRWGGEEFVVLLPETGPKAAQRVAERLRLTLAGFRFEGDLQVTASIGVAAYREEEELASLMERADACMYAATEGGRNRVVIDAEDVKRECAGRVRDLQLVNLPWRASYRSGNSLIDAEHQQLFHLTNLIIAALEGQGTEAGILPLVRELIAHVEAHFRHEERLLIDADFPAAVAHCEGHRELLERACELAEEFERGRGSASEMLGFLIHDVVAGHMLQEDRKFFAWLRTKQR